MRCTNCGHENVNEAKFCTGCGMKLRAASPTSRNSHSESWDRNLYQKPVDRGFYQMHDEFQTSGHRRREKKDEKRMVIIGIILAIVVAVVGIGAFFLYKYFNRTDDAGTANAAQVPLIVTKTPNMSVTGIPTTPTVTPQTVTATPTPAVTTTPTPAVTATPTPTPVTYTATRVNIDTVNLSDYTKAGLASASASSTIVQEGNDNSAQMVYDDDEVSSWQEGVDGDGLGEFITLNLDGVYDVKYITFKLGNWRDDQNYADNNRPKTLTIEMGGQSFEITFPDGRQEYCVAISEPCPADSIIFTIDSVYKGDAYDDTVIAEIGIYGE